MPIDILRIHDIYWYRDKLLGLMGIKKFNVVVQRSLGSRVIEMICFCHGCLAKSMWNRKCKFHV